MFAVAILYPHPMNPDSIFVKVPSGDPMIYQRPTSTQDIRTQIAKKDGAPEAYARAFAMASQHTGYPVRMLIAHAKAENGGVWNPALRGRRDPSDLGITQMNPIAWSSINGKDGGKNYFKDHWGHDADPANGQDQILGAATYLNHLKQFDLPARGVKAPNAQNVFTAYNTGASNVNSARGRSYQALLARSGAAF